MVEFYTSNYGGVDQKLLQDIEKYTDDELSKIAKPYDETCEFPREPLNYFFEKGFFRLLASSNHDDLATFLEIIRIVSKRFAALASILLTQGFYAISPLFRFGTSSQQKKFLAALMSGNHLGAFGLSETQGGSDPSYLQTTAVETNQGWVLNGRKQTISNAPVAEHFIIAANAKRLNGDEGIGLFIVERSNPGLTVGDKIEKMGIKSLPLAPVFLEDVLLEKDHLLGEELNGRQQIEQIMNSMKLAVSMQALGISQGAFDKGMYYTSLVRKFGKRLIDNQPTQQAMAKTKTQIHAAQSLAQQVIQSHSQDTVQVAMLKLLTADLAIHTTESVIQLTGGYGYMRDSELERYDRDAKVTAVYGESSESQMKIIAQPWLNDK